MKNYKNTRNSIFFFTGFHLQKSSDIVQQLIEAIDHLLDMMIGSFVQIVVSSSERSRVMMRQRYHSTILPIYARLPAESSVTGAGYYAFRI